MIAVVDTSALAKLLIEESESPELRTYLADDGVGVDEWVISTIAVTELRRLAVRVGVDPVAVERVIRPFRMVQLTDGMLYLAGRLPHRHLGTLDAIHIASALSIGAAVFVSFGARQITVTELEGLSVVAPGREA